MKHGANPPVDENKNQIFVNVLLYHRSKTKTEQVKINVAIGVFQTIKHESHCFPKIHNKQRT